MAIPHRNFTKFHHISAHGYGASNFLLVTDWANDHITENIIGLKKINFSGTIWERYDVFYKGTDEQGWGEISGADGVMSVCASVVLLPPFYNSKPITTITLARRGCLYRNLDDWDTALGTGRYADGVSAEYFDYPHDFHMGDTNMTGSYSSLPVPTVPTQMDIWHEAYNGWANDALSYLQKSYILTRGMILGISYMTPDTTTWTTGNGLFMNVNIDHVRIKYFNPVCNSFSQYVVPAAGGIPLVLHGLGFHNDEAEIDEGGTNRFVESGTYWLDYVDHVYIEDLDGNVVETLYVDLPGVPGSRDFTYGSNTEITIYSMPALSPGVYQLRLLKHMAIVDSVDCEAYAGDWRCDAAGRMTPGNRLYLYVGEPGGPVVRSKWRFRHGDQYIFRYYAPIDVRASLTFYDGLILSMSAYTRGTNDDSGLPLLPDLEVELDNSSQEFSKLLAEYWVKNQLVEFYYSWTSVPDAMANVVYRGVVVDYDLPHSTWKVKLQSVLAKYLTTSIPKYRCTADEYPNIHPNHVNREMPEVLGIASLTTGSTLGAVEAIYVDTVNHEYLAARGSLHAVPEVYSDSVLVAAADYTIVYKDGGRTYIDFDNDQGDAKITFNAEGYEYTDWNDLSSASDFVMNPAYVILFVLAFFLDMADTEIDFDAFDDLADLYDTLGFGQSGYLVLQDAKDGASVLQELLWTYGAKTWPTADGKVTIGRKDVTDISYAETYYDQIDALKEIEKPTGFELAVNYAPLSWQYFPTANYYVGAKLATRDTSITAFEAELMPGSPWAFPWTADESLVDMRVEEELLKHGFGDYRLRVDLSIEHIEEIDILYSFAFQDPFALNVLGLGSVEKLYYVERITYDLMAGTLGIEAIDMDYILRQYFILGDELAIADNWSTASESDKVWGYLCDEVTWEFADGEPGKIMIDENAGG